MSRKSESRERESRKAAKTLRAILRGEVRPSPELNCSTTVAHRWRWPASARDALDLAISLLDARALDAQEEEE